MWADSLLPCAADGKTEARRGSVTADPVCFPLVSLSTPTPRACLIGPSTPRPLLAPFLPLPDSSLCPRPQFLAPSPTSFLTPDHKVKNVLLTPVSCGPEAPRACSPGLSPAKPARSPAPHHSLYSLDFSPPGQAFSGFKDLEPPGSQAGIQTGPFSAADTSPLHPSCCRQHVSQQTHGSLDSPQQVCF